MRNEQNNVTGERVELEGRLEELEKSIIELEEERHYYQQERLKMERELTLVKESFLYKQATRAYKWFRLASKVLLRKRSIHDLINPKHQMKKAKPKIKKLRYRLNELGFTKKALTDLEQLTKNSDNPFIVRYAAWELALWHANQYTRKNAMQALQHLKLAYQGEKDEANLRRIAIIEAECYLQLEERKLAEQIIDEKLKHTHHDDLYLAKANLQEDFSERIKWINQVFKNHGMMTLDVNSIGYTYDDLLINHSRSNQQLESHKVTVIIPVFNAEGSLSTTLCSILNQTWSNLEIFVVDDGSQDQTVQIIEEFQQQDQRIHLLKNDTNSGPYVARNRALQVATGDFVTINDADDWSHPEKIEHQVQHLIAHPSVIANTSEQARATETLMFYRRGKPGEYLFPNMSSLMFRREPVVKQIGYWDSVRFGADGEFKKRLKIVFGKEAVVDLKTGPYSFQRQSSNSLTGNSVFGYHGYFMGARKAYTDEYEAYHKSGQSLYYPFPQEERPFPIPEPMWPKREDKLDGRRHFDVIIASEFRLLGGTNMSNVEEIKAQTSFGMRTGLVQLSRYDLNSATDMNPRVRELIDGDQVALLVYGEKVSCDVLIVRHPPILEEWQKYIPDIEAKQVRVIVNQPPKREYSQEGKTLYHIERCVKHLKEYVGQKGVWYPIGPSIREALEQHHANELKSIHLSDEDWVNIIDVNEWRREQYERKAGVIRIGRHSRDQYVKWPSDREELLKVYPDHGPYEVHVLGGAKAPKEVLGEIPSNWTIYEFGSMAPKNFLKELDVFIYYTHPDWVEAFGRVIFEAMAVGVPVIIPPSYEPLFKEAAIYAKPEEVQAKVKQLMEDKSLYQKQVDLALTYVDEQFGYRQHSERLFRS